VNAVTSTFFAFLRHAFISSKWTVMQRRQIVLAETEAADGLGAARVGRCIAHDRALAILVKLFLFFANVVRFSKRSLNDIVSMRGT
jgi:hypothetical protein